ncbi:DNA-3-methyladenine glycosylase family protein [Streptomyces bauhiniae]|uniref:DNA-3-methyladenine glycosylase 2 family protein n=1 Tax=Streptomyces bauhiniae TaxID=2340725 RepID=A0A7K3QUC9_9ACTN|nr:DNA-3-methyladenine glycosylase 2 family protein [Streptomyces bauhiniae]NEB93524.1 DNA-3-methyladenine glycosylase 2 family protein [Streptomyces bauhiniae]
MHRCWVPPTPYDLNRTLRVLRRGAGDPTCRLDDDGTWWRVSRTPLGPATLRITDHTGYGRVITGQAWGPGAQWALATLPALLGADDDPDVFVPHHRVVAAAHHRHAGLHLARTGLVMETLVPTILEQRITTGSARYAWRRLLRRYGEQPPGPAPAGMRVPPPVRGWRMIPSWQWHRAGVDRARAATILRACLYAPRLEEAAAMPLPQAMARLQHIPGIGPWTAAETLQRTNGAADALTLGDLHLPAQIGYALTGRRDTTDDDMLDLLAPYADAEQRHRAARLILLGGRMPNRRTHRAPHSRIAHL